MMESLLKWTLLQLLIAACFKTGVLQNNHITLTSSLEVVLENRSVFLTCSSTTGALSSSHWNTSFYENQVAQCARTNDNTCFKSHFLNNSALFDCICNDNGTFTVLLKQVGRYQHGSTWNCRNYFEISNTVVINVSVPVKHAILTWSENQPLNENTNVTLTCKTSYCLPSAQIHWYRTYMSSTVEITAREVEIKRKTESAEGNVKKVTEILSYMVNRSVNGWNVYCTATNWRSDEVSSVKIVLSVIYPPDKPPVVDELLNGSTYRVIENEKVSLSCSVEGGNPLAKPEWHCERMNNITTKERITNNKTVISYLSWMAKRTDGKTCTCKMGHVLSNVSLYVNIDVLYTPGIPFLQIKHLSENKTMTSAAELIEHKSYRLMCMADANPPSEYIWDGPQTPGISYNSTFDLPKVTRTEKGTYICHARNILYPTYGESRRKENTNSVNLDILYPPDIPPVIGGASNGSTYRVIENEKGNLSCSVTGGNPLAKPKWHCEHINNYSSNERTNNVEVTSYLFWVAKRTDGRICNCEILHLLLNVSMYVEIDVLYPPGTITLQLEHETERTNVTSDAKLIENRFYRLLCSADANPPSEYIWDAPQISGINNVSLALSDVTRIHKGTYTCHARNTMHSTFGQNVTKENMSSISIDVLYKPTLIVIQNQDVVESSSLYITCGVISANPYDIFYNWTRSTGDFHRNSKELILQNISRHDATNYTCTVKNYMIPTVGKGEEGYASETFYLNVWYKASVTKFVVNGYAHDVHLMTKESNTIILTCEIDSNPASIVKIITPNGTEIISVGTNVLEYDHFISSCVDNGTYTCSGSNDYNNGQPGISTLAVSVKCTPMAYHHIVKEMRSKLHAPVTLKFRALAYPEPEFTWEKWANTSWHKITNDNVFSISSFELQSTLTIINFTTSTPNVYRLIVENEIGRFIQNYTLKSFDHPGTPMDFSYMKELLTDTSVTLLWKPGLNGGIPQTFIIMYKGQKDKDWNNTAIQDTGNTVMNLTVQGLSSDTSYTFQLLAVNGEGSSGIVALQIKTKHYSGGKQGENSPPVAGIVLGVLSVLVLATAVPVFIFLRRRYQKTRHVDNKERSYENLQEMRTMSERRVNEKNEQAYEILQPGHDPDGATNPIYMNLKL